MLALRGHRWSILRRVLDEPTEERLAAGVTSAVPFLEDAEGLTVATCLRVVVREEWEHRLYAERDLAALGGGTTECDATTVTGEGPAGSPA